MANETRLETARSQMRKGMLEFAIMLIISRGKVYASEILAKLKGANLIVVEGTLYPLLSRLKFENAVSYTWEESKSGPPRKYYVLTDEGARSLESLKRVWKELYSSIESLTNHEKND